MELVEDDQAVYLKGTFWLAAYDEQLARAAAGHLNAWAAEHDLADAVVHF